jgi:hypothetical protein
MFAQFRMAHLGGEDGGDIGQGALGQIGEGMQHCGDEHIPRRPAYGVEV